VHLSALLNVIIGNTADDLGHRSHVCMLIPAAAAWMARTLSVRNMLNENRVPMAKEHRVRLSQF
jgi:hypothetical protein